MCTKLYFKPVGQEIKLSSNTMLCVSSAGSSNMAHKPEPKVIKLFVLNSTEHEIYQAHKCYNANINQHDKYITTSEHLKARKVFVFKHFRFYEQL